VRSRPSGVTDASPALLRYVSGLNQLTARRLYDYRAQNGPFRMLSLDFGASRDDGDGEAA
jgi:hypothetical protein